MGCEVGEETEYAVRGRRGKKEDGEVLKEL